LGEKGWNIWFKQGPVAQKGRLKKSGNRIKRRKNKNPRKKGEGKGVSGLNPDFGVGLGLHGNQWEELRLPGRKKIRALGTQKKDSQCWFELGEGSSNGLISRAFCGEGRRGEKMQKVFLTSNLDSFGRRKPESRGLTEERAQEGLYITVFGGGGELN